MPSLLECWQAVLNCFCNTRGTWCASCCDNFGAIGDALARKWPVCVGECEVTVTCKKHE